MPMWLWVGIGLGAFFAVSLVVGLVVAAALGAISREVTAVHHELFEGWAELPPSRAVDDVEERAPRTSTVL
jgi:hypothetical protein